MRFPLEPAHILITSNLPTFQSAFTQAWTPDVNSTWHPISGSGTLFGGAGERRHKWSCAPWFWLLPSLCEFFESTVRQRRARGTQRKGSLLQLPGFLISGLQLPQPHPFPRSHFLHFRQGLQSLQVDLFLPRSNKHSPTCNSYQTCSEKKINKYLTEVSLLYGESSSVSGQATKI